MALPLANFYVSFDPYALPTGNTSMNQVDITDVIGEIAKIYSNDSPFKEELDKLVTAIYELGRENPVDAHYTQLVTDAIANGEYGFRGGYITANKLLEKGLPPRMIGQITHELGYIKHPSLKNSRHRIVINGGRAAYCM